MSKPEDELSPQAKGLLDPMERLAMIAVEMFAAQLMPHLCPDCRLWIPKKIRDSAQDTGPLAEH